MQVIFRDKKIFDREFHEAAVLLKDHKYARYFNFIVVLFRMALHLTAACTHLWTNEALSKLMNIGHCWSRNRLHLILVGKPAEFKTQKPLWKCRLSLDFRVTWLLIHRNRANSTDRHVWGALESEFGLHAARNWDRCGGSVVRAIVLDVDISISLPCQRNGSKPLAPKRHAMILQCPGSTKQDVTFRKFALYNYTAWWSRTVFGLRHRNWDFDANWIIYLPFCCSAD